MILIKCPIFVGHYKISNRTQKQLQAFTEENPSIKQPKSEPDQSLKR